MGRQAASDCPVGRPPLLNALPAVHMSYQRLLASGGDRHQALDAGQYGSEPVPGNRDLRKLKDHIPGVLDYSGPDLGRLLAQGGQRPVPDAVLPSQMLRSCP